MIFLVQGKAEELDYWEQKLSGHEYILAAWDKPRRKAEYIPNTTWASGRKVLYQKAKARFKHFDYVTFIDADAKIHSGSLNDYLNFCYSKNPSILVPWCDKLNSYSYLKFLSPIGGMFDSDELFQTFSTKYLKKYFNNESPYTTKYDDLSWWYSCYIAQANFRSLEKTRPRIFSKLDIVNSGHGSSYSRKMPWAEKKSILQEQNVKINYPLRVYSNNAPWYLPLFSLADHLYVIYTYLFK